MMKHSVLNDQQFKMPLGEQEQMRPRKKGAKKALVMSVTLTSLVDVFSVLVIYLLVNTTAATETLEIDKNVQLPVASHSKPLEKSTVIKIEEGRYFLNDEPISIAELSEKLNQIEENKKSLSLSERPKLVIQADRRSAFAQINPIILSSSAVGFYKIKFAVLHKERL